MGLREFLEPVRAPGDVRVRLWDRVFPGANNEEFAVAIPVAGGERADYSAGMSTAAVPRPAEMERAFYGQDASYDGVFVTGVRTTGIFCRPSCSARRPLRRNVEFFASIQDAPFRA